MVGLRDTDDVKTVFAGKKFGPGICDFNDDFPKLVFPNPYDRPERYA